MGVYLDTTDLEPFAAIEAAKAAAMIEDAEAQAVMVAPCLADSTVTLTDAQRSAVRATLRRAILRWNDTGSGAVTQQSAGPFQVSTDTTHTSKGLFWPSEIADLQSVCRQITGSSAKAFTIYTGSADTIHALWCDINFGGATCSCGASIAGYPIYEV